MYKSKILLKYIFSEELDVKDLTEEKYNQDYEALTFSFKEETYQSRLAKKTPTKAGYFVACWTKDENNCNQPYSKEAFADYLMIIVIDEELSGYFLFPIILSAIEPFFKYLSLCFVSRLAEQRKHVAFICLYARLIKRIYSQQI